METLIDLQSQIEKLRQRAEEIKAKEFNSTVADIVAKMQAFGISLKDVQAAMGKPGRSRKGKARTALTTAKPTKSRRSSAAKGTKVAAKYKGPNGEAWSGRGLPPKWMAELIAQGRRKEEFAI